jgi:hypothetical protein
MTKIKHTATGPNGEVFTRTSKTRAYSHMACGRPSLEYAMKTATSDSQRAADLRNFDHWFKLSNGTSRFLVRKAWEKDDAQYADRVAGERARADEVLNGSATADDYAASQLAGRIARIEAAKVAGYYDRFIDLGWSSRLDLAQKVAASAGAMYAETRVIEAVQQA